MKGRKEMIKQAKKRPQNYNKLSPREQWEIDKQLYNSFGNFGLGRKKKG